MVQVTLQAQHLNDTELTSLMEKARKKYGVPGISVVMFDKNRILHHVVTGIRKKDSELEISREDYFHIGSTSKSILAILAGKQVELGTIRWDTRYFEVFPEMKDTALQIYHHITLEDLFLCKAGIKPFTTGQEKFPELNAMEDKKMYEFAEWLFRQSPVSQQEPDGKFSFAYSNAGYAIIALMLEKVSGKSYEILLSEFAKDYLKQDFLFGWPNNYDSLQPWGHGNFSFNKNIEGVELSKNTLVPFEPGNGYKLNDLIRPAGDISMKPLAFATFAQLFLQGINGTDHYITTATLKHIALSKSGFSLGVVNTDYLGKSIIGFDGSAGTFYCRGMVVPSDNIGFTIMTNSGSKEAVDWLTGKMMKKYYKWWWKFWM